MFLRKFVGFLLVTLFNFIKQLCFRVFRFENTQISYNPNFSKLDRQEAETENTESSIVEYKDTKDEDELKVFSFEFQFPSYDEFVEAYTRNDNVGLISDHLEDSSNSAEKLENNLIKDFNFNQDFKLLSDQAFDFKSDSDLVSGCEFPAPSVGSITGFLSETDFETAISHGDLDGDNSENKGLIEENSDSDTINYLEKDPYKENQDTQPNQCKILTKLDDFDLNSGSPSSEINGKILEEFDTEGKKYEPKTSSRDSEDRNILKTVLEHKELIKQLNTELKRVRATCLPTILEEDESQKISDDLRPRKIDDEKFRHEDRMRELHEFYKSYSKGMRKFDILNYQKMYAIGFLQSKDPLQAITSINPSSPPFFKLRISKKKETDPTIKFMRQMHTDLETVYVAQMCLSWDILHWQYDKALELCDSDPYGTRKYNKITGDEFQQFQVIIQRFLENEPFEGPRVQNYIKNRCVLRNFIQVPAITEGMNMKDKGQASKVVGDENGITSDMLVEIMEESISIFWRFVRADKDADVNVNRKGRKGHVEPTNFKLLVEVQASLQKKEKKLKDMLRSGNCILRKIQKREEEEGSNKVLYFFSQVDMKLVARVLNMSTITRDQLLWCHKKLSKINFVNRKLHVEPSFSLFPC